MPLFSPSVARLARPGKPSRQPASAARRLATRATTSTGEETATGDDAATSNETSADDETARHGATDTDDASTAADPTANPRTEDNTTSDDTTAGDTTADDTNAGDTSASDAATVDPLAWIPVAKRFAPPILSGESSGDSCSPLPLVEVPVLPEALARFLQASRRDDVSLNELGDIVESDAGLAARLLRHLNSGVFGLRQKVKSVARAISLIGLAQAKTFLLAAAVQEAAAQVASLSVGRELFHGPTLARVNLQRGLLARVLAEQMAARHRAIDPETAFAAGLMQDVLLPVLCDECTDEYVALLSDADETTPLCDRERARFGWTHADATAMLLAEWGLPREVAACVLLHHRLPEVLADPVLAGSPALPVALAGLLPDGYQQSIDGLGQLFDLEDNLGLNLDQAAARVDLQIEKMLAAKIRRVPLAGLFTKRRRELRLEEQLKQQELEQQQREQQQREQQSQRETTTQPAVANPAATEGPETHR